MIIPQIFQPQSEQTFISIKTPTLRSNQSITRLFLCNETDLRGAVYKPYHMQ